MAKKKTNIVFIDRFFNETPKYWKKIRNISASLAAGAVALIAINKSMELGFDSNIIQWCKYAIAIGSAIAAMAQNTKK